MPTRKQRARRAKTFRHDYALVDVDEEGNEVELRASELRAKKSGDTKGGDTKGGGSRSAKAQPKRGNQREPQPPSWNRALRRGLPIGALAGAVLTLLAHASPIFILIYGVAFVPMTYWTDSYTYRRFERKKAEASGSKRPGKTR